MVKKILHLSDIHIHNSTNRYEEYQIVFNRLYKYIEEKKPDRIVICGDLFHDYIKVSNEAKLFAGKFIDKLSSYTKLILTLGNHDLQKQNRNRIPSPRILSELMNNKNIFYYEKSGFYEDDNIVWVNYSHLEKENIPWENIKHEKDNSKIYISLFHDPVYGCKLPNGIKMEKKSLVNLDIFKNEDISFFGDIHKRQYFKNNKMAYSGSLIQQNFGELPYGHGGILWTINENKEIKSENIDIQNDWVYLNEYLEEENYDNLTKFKKSKYSSKNNELKIHWKDYSVNINLENEQKIRNYFSNLYDLSKDKIIIKKNYLNTGLVANKQLDEKINLNDKKELQEIFYDYLKENKYSKEKIKELLKLDDLITDKLDFNDFERNVNWKIDKLWIDNFKSYNKAELDFQNKNGLTQIIGKNQFGKSTLIDCICYVLFGTTLSTNKLGGAKREKNGDNRYINNKQNKDYCSVGIQINANGEKFLIQRKTERELNKSNEISKVSTNIDFYKDSIKEENKLNDEQRKDTQKKLDNMLGNFEDFIRLSLTNSENLNNLLSLDRATFIDSIIRDAGYDIFEKKLEIFKQYKKDNLKNSINIDLNETLDKIEELKENKNKYTNKIKENEKDLLNLNNFIKEKEDLKNSEIKILNKIDENIANLDLDNLNSNIEEYNNNISKNLKKQNENIEKMNSLKFEYDEESYNSKHFEIRRLRDLISDLKIELSNFDNRIEKENNKIEKVDIKVNQLIENEIEKTKRNIENTQEEIEKIKKDFDLKVENEINEINSKIKDIQYKIKSNESELKYIKENGSKIKKEIKNLEEDKICPTCGQEYNENEKIEEKKEEIKKLMDEVNSKFNENKLYKENIENFKNEIKQIKLKNFNNKLKKLYDDINEQISIKEILIKNLISICSKLENKNYEDTPELYQKIVEGNKIKEKSLENIGKEETKKDIKEKEENVEKLEKQLSKLEKEKEEVKTYQLLKQENNELKLKIDNIKLIIESAKNKIEQYNNQIENIEKNKIINEKIKKIEKEISEKIELKNNLLEKLEKDKSNLIILNKDLDNLIKNYEDYKEQIKKEELFKEYSKIIHRDGIPTYLLKQSISLINEELDELLNDVDFNVKFNDDLKLKLNPKNNIKIEQNALESSGKERTFAALSLKTALRAINNKPKGDIIFFDEVMGKLVDESVNEFIEFLNLIKQKISLIMIIEHNHTIDYDYVINVSKDNKGISSLIYE